MKVKKSSLQLACRATRWLFLAFGLGISSWAPMVPFVKLKLDVDDGQLGVILFIFGIGALAAMPLAGYFIHKAGTRLISFLSALSVIAILPLLTVSSSIASTCLVLFLFGIATGILNVSINAQAVEVETLASRHIMSGFHCLFSTGGLFGALIISGLLQSGFSLLFCALAVSSFMFLIVMFHWQHLLPPQKNDREAAQGWKFSFPGSKVLFLGMICFISFMAEGSMLDWSAEFLHSVLDYAPDSAGIGYALFSIAMALGRYFGDRLIGRWGNFAVFQTGSLIAAGGFLIVVSLGYGYLELLGFCLIGFGASNIVPILFSSTGRLSAKTSSAALTIVTTFGYAGTLAGPAFIGFLAQATTLSFAFLSLSFLLIIVGFSGRRVISTESLEPIQNL